MNEIKSNYILTLYLQSINDILFRDKFALRYPFEVFHSQLFLNRVLFPIGWLKWNREHVELLQAGTVLNLILK